MDDLLTEEVKQLLNQFAHGDDQAAIQLYKHYFGFLFSFVRHRIADSHAAEDITQDVFLAVLRSPQGFSGHAKFSTWLCAIAKNKCADWHKNSSRMGQDSPTDDVQDELVDPNWDFVGKLESRQDDEALRHCIEKLPPDHREAIFWVYYQDEGVEAAAKHLDCPPGTVKSRLFNARKKLHDCMSRWIAGGRYG